MIFIEELEEYLIRHGVKEAVANAIHDILYHGYEVLLSEKALAMIKAWKIEVGEEKE